MPPGKKPLEVLSKGELSDPHPDFVVTDGFLWFVIEDKIAEVRVRIETTQICNEKVHESAVCLTVVTGFFQLNRIEYGIRSRIVGVLAGDHLFHLIRRSRTALDDRFGQAFNRYLRFSPVVLVRKPHTLVFKLERCETEGSDIKVPGLDFSGEIGMSCVAPLLSRRDRDELTRYDIPRTRGPECDMSLSRDAAGGRISLHGQSDQFTIVGQVDRKSVV